MLFRSLHLICTISGLATFGAASYAELPLKGGYKLVVFLYLLIYLLQASSMLAGTKAFLISTNVFDGLAKGGLLLIVYELSAELAYPLSEPMSLGFLNALHSGVRFLVSVIAGSLTFTTTYNPSSEEKVNL